MTIVPSGGPLVLAGATPDVIARLRDPAALLSAVELGRAQRLRSGSDRADFMAAHGLVRLVAGLVLGVPAGDLTVVQRCARCGGEHGQPQIAEAPMLRVSLSHTRGFVAAIAGAVPVAVDVDHPPQPAADAALLRLALSPTERADVAGAADPGLAFARYWVRKESFVKLGLSTLDTLANCELPGLSVEQTWSTSTAGRRLRWREWHLIEWLHPATRTVGTAIAGAPLYLAQLADPVR